MSEPHEKAAHIHNQVLFQLYTEFLDRSPERFFQPYQGVDHPILHFRPFGFRRLPTSRKFSANPAPVPPWQILPVQRFAKGGFDLSFHGSERLERRQTPNRVLTEPYVTFDLGGALGQRQIERKAATTDPGGEPMIS